MEKCLIVDGPHKGERVPVPEGARDVLRWPKVDPDHAIWKAGEPLNDEPVALIVYNVWPLYKYRNATTAYRCRVLSQLPVKDENTAAVVAAFEEMEGYGQA